MVADNGLGVVTTVLFGIIGMAGQALFLGTLPPGRVVLSMAALCVGGAAALGALPVFLKRAVPAGKVGAALRSLRTLGDNLRRLCNWHISGYSVAAHGALLLQTAALLAMFGSRSLIVNAAVAAEVYAFMLVLPFFIANIGLREFTFGMMFASANIAFCSGLGRSSVALGVSTVILAINVVLPAVAGLGVMLLDKRHKSTV